MAAPKPQTLKMDMIATAQFTGSTGNTSYMVIGLSEDGNVYRYEKGLNGWVPLNMEAVKKPEREPSYVPKSAVYFCDDGKGNFNDDDDIPF